MATNESWVPYQFTTTNGLSRSAEPASSILAAQLPQLVSQGNSAHGYLTRETFSQLRQELVDGKCSQLRLDDSIADASKLICIVLQAGVEPCVKGDRSRQGDSEGQILDCLDIVQTILEKSPQVLGEICDPTVLGENASVPLYAWLTLQLLSLLSWEANNIGKRITCIFSSITRPHDKHITLLPSCYSALALLRACTNEIFLSLESHHYLSRQHMSEVKLSIPAVKSAIFLTLDNLNLPRALLGKKITLGTFPQTLTLALRLLDSFVPKRAIHSHTSINDPTLHQDLAWIVNGIERLWKITHRWVRASIDDIEIKSRICLQFTSSLHIFRSLEPDMSGLLSPRSGLARPWLQICSELVTLSQLTQMPHLQAELGRLLNGLIDASQYRLEVVTQLRAALLPTMIEFKSKDTIHSFEPGFQAVLQILMGPVSGDESRSRVDLQEPNTAGQMCRQDEVVQHAILYDIPRPQEGSAYLDTAHKLISETFELLGCEESVNIGNLSRAISESFVDLPEQKKSDLFYMLGKIACAMAGSLSSPSKAALKSSLSCCVCESEKRAPGSELSSKCHDVHELCGIFTSVLPRLTRASSVRITAMNALRKLLIHAPPESSYLQLKSSVFGDLCLHSLRSSIRELRIVTGHLVISFVRKDINAETRRSNFVVILEWLRSLSEKQELPLHETCILSLCHIAEVSDDEEMNIILLRLLEYLGHSNPFICAVAYTELSKLAQHLSVTPAGLFRPFWRTLSITVVKNFQSRPHMAEQLCDLLGMNVDDLLRLTEVHILPYLVLTRKRDVITRVGAAYKDVKTPFDICSEKNNLAAILAFLMSQPWSDPEGMIMSVLSDIDSAFGGRTLAELVRTEPILIACDLLKGLGDSGSEKCARFHRALHLLAALVPRKSTATSKKANLLCHFIEEHVLGIITQFAHAINDFQIRQPLIEKRRNILAIGEMIKVARGHISSALPQICACLRSALSIEELSDHAFSAWSVLVSSLHEEELEPLIDQTFSIVIRYWSALNDQSRKTAHELVGYILRSHSELVHTNFSTIPSLASIPALSALESEISKMKGKMDVRSQLSAFGRRCQSENAAVVEQALRELLPCLSRHEEFLHESVLSEQPDPVVAQLTRSLLDCCVKFNAGCDSITLLSAQCLGLVGCLDPNRVDPVKDKKDILVLSNFDRMEETFDFVLFFLQHVLVQAFLSASNTRAQGFLAYAMQNLLRLCNLDSAVTQRSRDIQADEKYRRWSELPETVRNTLTPFLTSKYTVTVGAIRSHCKFPIFSTELTHGDWLRSFVQDLLQRGSGDNAQLIFSVCSRIIKGQDISIASFLLPFAVLNRIVGGTQEERLDLQGELTTILSHPLPEASNRVHEAIILCSQSVFEILDYLSRWLQGKKKLLNSLKNHASHTGRSHKDSHRDSLSETYSSQVKAMETFLTSIPPEVISKRAVECKSFSRALFHWEQYIRRFKSQSEKNDHTSAELLYQHLQVIYSQIDEPDGIEGISTHLHMLNIDQQVLEHRKAGRWVTAQSWYELQVEKEPDNVDAQWNLLTCLRESGQQDAIIARFDTLNSAGSTSRFLPFAVEASWNTGNWDKLRSYLQMRSPEITGDFNIGVGSALCALRLGNKAEFRNIIHDLQLSVAKSLTVNSVTSLQSCHDSILKLHALTEMELISDCEGSENSSLTCIHDVLNRRLDILGGYIADKQYLLGLRRATMELTHGFMESDIAGSWLTSARLSRKGNYTNQAYHSMLRAARLKDRSATIEHARLLWKDGHHRKAIQTLEGAIAADEFASDASSSGGSKSEKQQNLLAARAHLLLAKWTDRAGQTQSDVIVQRYREAIKLHSRWEKAHYYLGKHYNKILESEKAKPLGKEAQIYLSGEASKLVIDNYLRSLAHGNKYVFQSLPRILTLWLEHAATVDKPFDPKRGDNEEFQTHTLNQRKKTLDDMHSQLKKYLNRMPAALLFTILPQVVARICHPHATVYELLSRIVAKVVNAFPQQGLWTVLAVVKSSSKDRASRGINCLHKITEANKKSKTELPVDMRGMINQGQKFSEEMLKLCTARIEEKASKIHLARHLGFNHKVAPCRLVVPFQAMLTPSLPASHETEYLKGFRAFPRDPTTIDAVLDDAQVLNSLQKPRKISIRGSDGKIYNVLCKPKDDLRKDQRLMEFNNTINRFLKRDVESSKRRMYIKTYAVTPLNEECGLIEWVDNLRTLREIIIKLLKERGIMPNYNEIRHYLNEACSESSKLHLFTTKVLMKFPPVLHEWFVEMFPETGAWFAARLRYTRSCAVMSMVGYVLGLGDRHGENILFEEGTGGVIHVDFNCLFDKGLTFDKPELVPFRLTQNMIDAFGAYGYNGPFRRTCEISLRLLRQNEDALMTVLETFLHDPTTDFIGRKRRTHASVPETPAGVLENVRNKLRGLLPGEQEKPSGHVYRLVCFFLNEN
ncbi:serine/threonine-protein kinase M1 [Aspergillus viridinutans]|uniref:Serine/threonine-protein kinase MEC1 n=1 Tax=Aspergillus viridinutans TaxID=75553 RepID=A0A9P3C9Y5_ASPVI|nr:serine/threonine-protein kinase M1 [Aspergillus viridinutans]GIK07921.1 serine/threonine-protein kinase M1 [Aspergillus viridinutans]